MNELATFNRYEDVTPLLAGTFFKAMGKVAGRKPRAATRGGRVFYAIVDLVPAHLKIIQKGSKVVPPAYTTWLRNNCPASAIQKIKIGRTANHSATGHTETQSLNCISEDHVPTMLVYLNHKAKGRNFAERWSSLPDSTETVA